MFRSSLILPPGLTPDCRRDLDVECGFIKNPTVDDYLKLYLRSPAAKKVVDLLPDACWGLPPTVYEDEDAEVTTPFEKAWAELLNSLRGETSYYAGDKGSPIWEVLKRADKLSGIGSYGIILLGLADNMLDKPVQGFYDFAPTERRGEVYAKDAKLPRNMLKYLRVVGQYDIQSIDFEPNRYSPRFGKPKYYHLKTSEADGQKADATRVHWSRAIHLVAESSTCGDIYGTPRMQPVLNRLLDLDKLWGCDAEGYYKGSFPGLVLQTSPALAGKGQTTIDYDSLRDMVADYSNGLQRYLALDNMEAHNLSPSVTDPTPHIKTQLEAIALAMSCPMRVFMGSERGELASSEDQGAWNDIVRDRQNNHCIPRCVVPFVNRLIQVSVLPEPAQGFQVFFADPETLKPVEKVDLAVKRTQALAEYVSGGVDALIHPLDYLTRVLEFTDDEAAEILERSADTQDDKPDSESATENEAAPALELLTANLAGAPRYELLNGRRHLVVPLSMIVPGVLHGSNGPLLYPLKELKKDPAAWDGMPIVVGHPKNSVGKEISAGSVAILEKFGVGTVLNAKVDTKLRAEGFIDEERAQILIPREYARMQKGLPVELSTGLFTDNHPVDNGKTKDGKSYVAIAKNYRPDHLAILPKSKGACSISDGCGVNVNERRTRRRARQTQSTN